MAKLDEPGAQPPGDEPSSLVPAVHRGREVCRALLRQALLDLGATAAAPPAASPASSPAPSPSPTAEVMPARQRQREVWLVDRHFADWPLDETAVLNSLAAWLRSGGGRLVLVGLDFETTARALPRFARWRRDWSHRIDLRCPADGLMGASLRGLVAGDVAWQWLDAPDWRLRQLSNPLQRQILQEQLADFLQQCEPAWPATTLGL